MKVRNLVNNTAEGMGNLASNVAEGVGNVGKKALRAREERAHSPQFERTMEKEMEEFRDILGGLGTNTWKAVVGILLETPYGLLRNSLKLLRDKEYNGMEFTGDALTLFFGKDGVVHDVLKVTASAVHLSAKGAKMATRKLFAI